MAEPISLAVNLAPNAFAKVQQRVRELGFANPETYLLYLIAIDLAEDKAHAAELMKLIYQAEATGEGRVADETYNRELRERTSRLIDEAAAESQRAVG